MNIQKEQDAYAESLGALIRESDRGVVLLLATFLDEVLGELHLFRIASHIVSPEKVYKSLTAPFAPLSSFAAKIKLAYSYGMIDEEIFKELELVRNIRNMVAHNKVKFSFDEPAIAAKVLKLRKTTKEEIGKKVLKMCKEQPILVTKSIEIIAKAGITVNEKNPDTRETRWHFILAGLQLEGKIRHLALEIATKA